MIQLPGRTSLFPNAAENCLHLFLAFEPSLMQSRAPLRWILAAFQQQRVHSKITWALLMDEAILRNIKMWWPRLLMKVGWKTFKFCQLPHCLCLTKLQIPLKPQDLIQRLDMGFFIRQQQLTWITWMLFLTWISELFFLSSLRQELINWSNHSTRRISGYSLIQTQKMHFMTSSDGWLLKPTSKEGINFCSRGNQFQATYFC